MAKDTELLTQRVDRQRQKLEQAATVLAMTRDRRDDAVATEAETAAEVERVSTAAKEARGTAKRLSKEADDAGARAVAAVSARKDAAGELEEHESGHAKRQKKLAKAEAALAAAEAEARVAEAPAPAKRAPAKRAPAKKAAVKKAPARKTPAKKTVATKTPTRKAPARKAPARKAAAKKAPTTRATPSRGRGSRRST